MWLTAGVILGWLICTVFGYIIVKRDFMRFSYGVGWTCGDRSICILISLIGAPVVIIITIISIVITFLWKRSIRQCVEFVFDFDRPAKW